MGISITGVYNSLKRPLKARSGSSIQYSTLMSALHPKERESVYPTDIALSLLFPFHPQYQDLGSTLMFLGEWVMREEKIPSFVAV